MTEEIHILQVIHLLKTNTKNKNKRETIIVVRSVSGAKMFDWVCTVHMLLCYDTIFYVGPCIEDYSNIFFKNPDELTYETLL